MTRHELEAIFARVLEWPEHLQEQFAAYALMLEQQQSEPYELTDKEWAEVEIGLAEEARGEFATDEEVEAVFAKYRLK